MSQEILDYLGDGLYASYDGYQVKLMANDPHSPSDKVYLEPSVIKALTIFLHKHKLLRLDVIKEME